MIAALETPRLVLRPFTPQDAPFALRLLNEPSFLEHIGDKGVRDLEGARAYLEGGPLASYARHGHGLMAVILKASGAPIGMCGLLKRDTLPEPDLGYAFLPEAWGQGCALEAAQAVLVACPFPRLLAIVSPANGASIRLLEKAGFAFLRREAVHPGEPELAVYGWAAASGQS